MTESTFSVCLQVLGTWQSMHMQHLTNADMCRFATVFFTYRRLLYIIVLLPVVVKLIMFILFNTSDNVGSQFWTSGNSHNLAELHDSVNTVFSTPIITDSSGEYRIIKWPPVKAASVVPGDTTLVSQCSVSHLHRFLDLRLAWDGPLSLAVFVESSDSLFIAVHFLLRMQLCLPPHTLSSLQLVMPLSASVDCCHAQLVGLNVSCSDFVAALDKHWAGDRNYDDTLDYPNNLLRNVALSAAVSDYVFVVDIDMLPSSGLFAQFHQFVSKQQMAAANGKTAYVVPAFELQSLSSEEIPTDRAALLRMWDHGVIRPFYREVCWKCQQYTDYNLWRNVTSKHRDEVDIAYMVDWRDPWEPFYIVDLEAPRYDENFKNYGFNRISQVSYIGLYWHHGSMDRRAIAVRDLRSFETRFDLNRPFRFDSKVMGRFENF